MDDDRFENLDTFFDVEEDLDTDNDDDPYVVLGLPSGEQGAKLTEDQIRTAYRMKFLELHPSRRPDDPLARSIFKRLVSSYDLLRVERRRREFDQSLRDNKDRLLAEIHRLRTVRSPAT